MQQPLTYFTILLCVFLSLAGCSSDDDGDCQGVDCLPAATQTGAGTFGCLINGEPFVDNSGNFNCFYQLVGGEYYFNVSALSLTDTPNAIAIATNMVELTESNIYQLLDESNGNVYAEAIFDYDPPTFINSNSTDNINTGTLHITRMDLDYNIVSGTFSFSIRDEVNDQLYIITEGRFDSTFTQ